jgi:hypothetical protein
MTAIVDRSGEAGETRQGLDPKGESAGRSEAKASPNLSRSPNHAG